MEKFDLTDCSIFISLHIDNAERLEHANYIHAYFDRYFCNHQLIVVEQGTEQPKFHLPPSSRAEYQFIKSDEEFSCPKMNNIGASLAKNPYICKCDADVVIHPKAIFDAFERVKRDPSTAFILPYNGVSFDIQNPLRKEVMRSFDFDRLPFVRKDEVRNFSTENIRLKNDDSNGLIQIFKASVFWELGGYNEELVGWGYDDDEVVARFEKLNHPKKHLEGYNAFHLEHPRTFGCPVQAFKNRYRSLAVKNMPPEEIWDYIKTWKRGAL